MSFKRTLSLSTLTLCEASPLRTPRSDALPPVGSWSGGTAQNVTVAIQDPAGQVAQVEGFSLNTTDVSRSGITRVAIRQPLRPGTWRVHVLADRVTVARGEFAIIPLELLKERQMNQDQAR